MEVIKCQDNTAHIKPRGAVIEALVLPEDSPELSPQAGLHQHVQVGGVLEGLVQLDYEWTAAALHDGLLCQDMLPLLRVCQLQED